MSSAAEDILTALICQHTKGRYKDRYSEWQTCDVTESSAREAARKIIACGFVFDSDPVDQRQDEEIRALGISVEQLRGWSGLPPELRR